MFHFLHKFVTAVLLMQLVFEDLKAALDEAKMVLIFLTIYFLTGCPLFQIYAFVVACLCIIGLFSFFSVTHLLCGGSHITMIVTKFPLYQVA